MQGSMYTAIYIEKKNRVILPSQYSNLVLPLEVTFLIGPIKGGLSIECRLKIFGNVRCQLGNKNVNVRLKWSVECQADNSECQCWPTLILVWMSVLDEKNGLVLGVGNTPFIGPSNINILLAYLTTWSKRYHTDSHVAILGLWWGKTRVPM